MTMASGKQALDAVKESGRQQVGTEVTLSTGYKVRLVPVAVPIIRDAMFRIKFPVPPKIYIESKGRDEENPNDPRYLQEVAETEERRSMAALDVVIIQGVELIDGIPEDDRWLRNLKLMHRRGIIDLDDYDFNDELDVEFLFKRYVALGTQDIAELSTLMGITEEDVAKAEETFPGTQK